MTLEILRPELRWAIEAAQEKKAANVTVLHLAELGGFVEDFILCTGVSAPQLVAISEAIEERLGRQSVRLRHREGGAGAEWLLLDYGYFVVHVFSERARLYYDLERLWRAAPRVDIPDDATAHPARRLSEPPATARGGPESGFSRL